MSVSSGSEKGGTGGAGAGANGGDYTRINWNPPGRDGGDSVSTKNATLALKTAIAVARAFDANCALRNPAKECTIPMFEPQELVLGEPLRSSGFFTDLALRGIKLTRNLQHGEFSEDEEEFRLRFAERSIDGHYAVKFLQKGIYNSVHAASAASDMMMETKILMNLAPHPNICQIYGVTAAGSDAFLSRGKEGFYIILDRLSGTMIQRINQWREQQHKDITTRKAKGEDDNTIALQQYEKLMQRLEVALDIGSALLFLSDRQIVFHLRPDKVGFDVRYSRIKLCDFGQARENGQLDQAPSLTKTDDIRTLAYTAPEVLCQAPVTVAADVYAYGVVLWEMLSLQRPFEGMSRSEHFEQVIMEGERPPLLPHIPKNVQNLIEKCWDPHLRPTMKKVYDTVEEILLFQDEKPEVSVLPVLLNRPPLESVTSEVLVATATSQEEPTHGTSSSSKTKRPLRRTKTTDGTSGGGTSGNTRSSTRRTVKREHQHQSSGSGDDGGPMRDKSKGSNHADGGGGGGTATPNRTTGRRSRNRTSTHDGGGGGPARGSHHEGMKDRSNKSNDDGAGGSHSHMVDESKDSHGSGPPMKDGSSKNKRVSRRSRTSSKKATTTSPDPATAAPTSQSKATSGGDTHPASEEKGGGGEDDSKRYSLPTILSDEPAATDETTSSARKMPAFGRSATSENVAPREKPSGGSSTSGSKAPGFGRSQTTTAARRSRR